jgi:hypothetical protein
VELELNMISIEAITTDWNALSMDEQMRQWSQFLQDLDAGEAGFHSFYLVLMPLWDCGLVPALIEEVRFSRAMNEAAADAAWELANEPLAGGWMDYSSRQVDPAYAADYGDPMF